MAATKRGDSDIPIWRLSRYRMSFLMFWGFAIVYALRVNLSVAIIDMVKHSTKNSTKGECAKNASESYTNNIGDISQSLKYVLHYHATEIGRDKIRFLNILCPKIL